MQNKEIILASSSQFRKRSLEQIQLKFTVISPDINEDAKEGENAKDLAIRLAMEKCQVIANANQDSIVIAGDQTLEVSSKIYGKPGNAENALNDLLELSGQSGVFYSAMCVAHQNQYFEECIETNVTWRDLSENEIKSYISKEPSFNSAGSAQLEKLGIALVSSMISEDPSAVIGVPLIKLCEILKKLDCNLLA